MKAKYLTAAALIALAILAGACDQRPTDDSGVLAVVNGQPVTENAYTHYLQLRNTREAPNADQETDQKVVLQELIDRILLSQRAVNQKLDWQPETALLLDRVRENILAQALVRKVIEDSPITEEQLGQRFEQELGSMHKTEYRARHILSAREAEATEVIAELQAGANFAKLAKAKSIDKESGGNGGEMGMWINQGMVAPEFFSGLIELNKGETSTAPVKSDFGWHVIKIDNTRPLQLPDRAQFMANPQARADLERKMRNELVTNLVQDLKDKATITIQ